MLLKTRILVAFILLTMFHLNILAADEPTFKERFLSASYYYLYEDYENALPIYLELYDKEPNNASLNFKIGYCYLQISGQKNKSIPFLEFAITNVSSKSNEFSYKETTAPITAFYRLGEAYHQNLEFDKAIDAYKKFKSFLKPKDIYNNDLVYKQIETCYNAKELYKYPVMVVRKNLGNLISTPYYDYNPVVSGDQKTLVFTSERKLTSSEIDSLTLLGVQDDFIQEVFYSKNIDGVWQSAKNISAEIGSNGFCSSVYLSEDGTRLLLMRDDYFDGNIYESRFSEGKWSEIKKLNKNINSKSWESHACLSRDGKTIFFSSDRKGGYGGFDIYKSEISEKGDWGEAINLGSTVNTKFDDDTPFILYDDKTLYFSSEGHYNMGGFDIFYTFLMDNTKWSLPLNLGYPINTPDDNLFMYPVSNGEFTYFADAKIDGTSGTDIYMMKLIVPENPGEFDIHGFVKIEDTKLKPRTLVTITMIDTTSKTNVGTFFSNIETGEFSYTSEPGIYELVFEADGYKTKKEFLNVPRILYRKEFFMNVYMTPTFIASVDDVVTSNETFVKKQAYVSVKSINFETSDNNIEYDSKVELEKLSVLLKTNPNLKVELESHSSSNISSAFDLKLAEKKQNDVVNYLAANGISTDRFSYKKVDVNSEMSNISNSLEIKVLKEADDSLIAYNDFFLPEKIRNKESISYTILLTQNNSKIDKNSFTSKYKVISVNEFQNDNNYFYTTGQFAQQYDAVKALNNIIESGLTDAKIIDNFELAELTTKVEPTALVNNNVIANNSDLTSNNVSSDITFTIQIGAYSKSIDVNTFNELKGITENKGNDGKFRYLYGSFNQFSLAKTELMRIIKLGYSDAFIMNYERYKK
ncbi:MAG: hypothetical protein A2046_04215 [Bacteroidetes bacterium GWA2_30_7]|nr:MAG: hypothetical protein A2046_04215 [Bacteroidetes bacterium GWA2_30_7]